MLFLDKFYQFFAIHELSFLCYANDQQYLLKLNQVLLLIQLLPHQKLQLLGIAMIRALLVGQEPAAELGYRYVSGEPYDAVVIGSLTISQLLRFREERVLQALAEGKSAARLR